ncbi:hypothetical protein BDV10DRAFT_69831 [Aspergillus recurvatus]
MNPPMPHPHHAAAHPGERPHVSFSKPLSPVNFDHLANQMNQVHIQQDRFSPSNEPRFRDFIANADIDEHAGTYYVGYTFFKAPAAPGYQPSWKKVEKTKMNLRQNDLADLVRKGSKKRSVADQYQSLSNVKRPHVDRLVENLRQTNPHFQWICVYVKGDTRDVKGKNFRRGDYETTSMHVILMGKATNRPTSEETAQLRDPRPVQAQRPLPETQHRPFVGHGPYPDPRGMSGYPQTPMPPHMHSMQSGPAQVHQQGPASFRLPPQNVMREPPYPEQANWTQNVPRSQPTPALAPVVHNHKHSAPAPAIKPDPPDHGAPRVAVKPDRKSHKKENPHQNTPRDPNLQAKVKVKREQSPKKQPEPEPDLVYDSASSDDILTPDQDYDISDEEFSSRETKTLKTPEPWRGSLYRGHSSSQPRHRYRIHYRKDPSYRRESQRAGGHGYKRYQNEGVIDIVPADSRHTTRHANRNHGGNRQWAAQPRIVHQQPSSDEMELLMSQIRGRAKNDIRSRMLEDWEADLADREHLFEYQKQIFKDTLRTEQMDGVGLLNRSRSLREHPAYSRGYMPRALHYY